VYVVLSGFAQVIVDLSAVPIHDIEMNDLKHYDQARVWCGVCATLR
jgi:hypothetical protein